MLVICSIGGAGRINSHPEKKPRGVCITMNGGKPVEYYKFQREYADELVLMWRASFERAVGVVDLQTHQPGKIHVF